MLFNYIKRTLYRPFSIVNTCPRKANETALNSGFRVKIRIVKFIENNTSSVFFGNIYSVLIDKNKLKR